jgi:phage-related protein
MRASGLAWCVSTYTDEPRLLSDRLNQELSDYGAENVLYQSRYNGMSGDASRLEALAPQGFGSAGVLEVIEDQAGNTYRAVYTVRIARSVFVLHVFQKKSKRGSATPGPDARLIAERLKAAEQRARELER